MYGRSLPKMRKGNIGTGLGQTTAQELRAWSLPTREISEEGETLRIDGVEIVFMSGTRRRGSLGNHDVLPGMKAFCVAEEINRTPAQPADLTRGEGPNGQLWSKYIDRAITECGDQVEVSFSPTIGRLGTIRTSSLTGKSSGICIATYTIRHFTSPTKDIRLEK